MQQEASGGRADIGGAEQSVRTIATVQTAEELGQMELGLPDEYFKSLGRVAARAEDGAPPKPKTKKGKR